MCSPRATASRERGADAERAARPATTAQHVGDVAARGRARPGSRRAARRGRPRDPAGSPPPARRGRRARSAGCSAAGARAVGRGERRRVGDRDAPPAERRRVGRDRDPVQLDGPLDRGGGERQRARLVGRADQQQVRRHRVAEQRLGARPGRPARRPPRRAPPMRSTQRRRMSGAGRPSASRDHGAGRHRAGRDDGRRALRRTRVAEVPRVGADEHVEREVRRRAVADPVGRAEAGRVGGDAQVRGDRPGLLREPGLVDAVHRAPVADGRRAEHLVDGDDAGAADAGQEHVAAGRAARRRARAGGSGRRVRRAAVRGARSGACTVTNDGQSPSRQE